jgi:hypothetical protein
VFVTLPIRATAIVVSRVQAVTVAVTVPASIDVITEDDPTIVSFIEIEDVCGDANYVYRGPFRNSDILVGVERDKRQSKFALQSPSICSYSYLFEVCEWTSLSRESLELQRLQRLQPIPVAGNTFFREGIVAM